MKRLTMKRLTPSERRAKYMERLRSNHFQLLTICREVSLVTFAAAITIVSTPVSVIQNNWINIGMLTGFVLALYLPFFLKFFQFAVYSKKFPRFPKFGVTFNLSLLIFASVIVNCDISFIVFCIFCGVLLLMLVGLYYLGRRYPQKKVFMNEISNIVWGVTFAVTLCYFCFPDAKATSSPQQSLLISMFMIAVLVAFTFSISPPVKQDIPSYYRNVEKAELRLKQQCEKTYRSVCCYFLFNALLIILIFMYLLHVKEFAKTVLPG